MTEREQLADPGDYAWVEEWGYSGVGFCLALIENIDPSAALSRVVFDPPFGPGQALTARGWAEARSERVWNAGSRKGGPNYDQLPSTIEASAVDAWSVTFEVNGFHATRPEVVSRMSLGTRAIVVYCNVNALMSFTYAVNGTVRRTFDPLLFAQTGTGPDSGSPLSEEAGLEFGQAHPRASSFALAERLSGLRLTRAFLERRDAEWVGICFYPAYSNGADSWRQHIFEDEPEPEHPPDVDHRLRRQWPGGLPSQRILNLQSNAANLALLDRQLIDLIEAVGPSKQRALANWSTRRAYAIAGLAGWAEAALAALERGEDLPSQFENLPDLFAEVLGNPAFPSTLVSRVPGIIEVQDSSRNISQQAMAIPAIRAAMEEDPLKAAIDALYTAAVTYGGDDFPSLLADARTFLRE